MGHRLSLAELCRIPLAAAVQCTVGYSCVKVKAGVLLKPVTVVEYPYRNSFNKSLLSRHSSSISKWNEILFGRLLLLSIVYITTYYRSIPVYCLARVCYSWAFKIGGGSRGACTISRVCKDQFTNVMTSITVIPAWNFQTQTLSKHLIIIEFLWVIFTNYNKPKSQK